LCETRKECDTCALFLESYGGEAVKKSVAYEWHKWLKVGRNNLQDDEDSAHHFLRY